MERRALLILLLSAVGCSSNPKPVPPGPPPDAAPVVHWNSDSQLTITWADMPVTVYGGDESYLLRRRSKIDLGSPRVIRSIQSFAGYDRGDAIEGTLIVYNQHGEILYRRTPHLEGGIPECYDADDDPVAPMSEEETQTLTIDIEGRTNGPNEVSGSLSSRHHLQFTVNLEVE